MSAKHLDAALLEAAADWAIRMRYETPDEQARHEFSLWLAQSESHAQAWARAQAVMGSFAQLPGDLGREVLRLRGQRRRGLLRAVVAASVALPAGWVAWKQAPRWSATYGTGVGERRAWSLDDGSVLVLNTDSAVEQQFTFRQRRLRLIAGEILLTSGPAQPGRPLLVETAQGEVEALGTRFSVRQGQGSSQVAVFEQAVELRPRAAASRRLSAGQQATLLADGASDYQAVQPSAIAWEHGMLVVTDWPLGEVLSELSRYRRGVLRCEPRVAAMRVSGALSVADTDAALALLVRRLDLRIARLGPYWTTLGPRV
ncbi:FecR domain-containing protein [Bordetella genomosp. 12]|uniref:Iron dicitrate transport regulator FecR n=1 Tax=Bordetella genomosp. 12 TaxID=463035 RepID=A0A261VBB5_9BORD|nr:FecR domain-containing protein [Bordetella genomosp. 12]OZI71379.1 hypothetical protein CAL22_16225 [Bordetella genomosp. 12]